MYGGTCRFDHSQVPNALILDALKSGHPLYVRSAFFCACFVLVIVLVIVLVLIVRARSCDVPCFYAFLVGVFSRLCLCLFL